MADTRTPTQFSTSTTSSTSSSKARVVVFELDTDHRRTASLEELEKEHITRKNPELRDRTKLLLTMGFTGKYQFDIKRWQRHVDVNIPGDANRSEASAYIAKVQIPTLAWLRRLFGNYKQMWAVSAT